MSSVGESPDGMALQSQYSLRWNNHQAHILQAFEALLHAEILVDVTLVCSETSLRAHKVVLSACSPFFERIFAEHPCKHPVIVLKDFPGREVSALIDFMYRGEIRVGREEIPGLIRAAESLQIRGLACSKQRPASPLETPTTDLLMGEPSTPEGARQETPEEDDNVSESTATPSRVIFSRDHMSHVNIGLRELQESCGSPLMPRRKQARPRRRSGELVPQDLSRSHLRASLSPPSIGLNLSNNQHHHQNQQLSFNQQNQQEDIAENLSMKKSPSPPAAEHNIKTESESASSRSGSPLPGISLRAGGSLPDLLPSGLPAMSTLSLTPPHHHSEYLSSLGQLAAQWLPNHPQNQLNHGHHPREDSPHNRGNPYQGDSPLTPRRSVAAFPMDGVVPLGGATGLFPHSGALDRGSLMTDTRDIFKPETVQGLFCGASMGHQPVKKSRKHRGQGDVPRRWSDHGRGLPVGRPKGQHSAPRGGPPRSWTNAELTEALQHVWHKNMTTSQASRVFGIPYNSLLMYVRGKYGKSLKLEQLRRDCTAATAGEVMNSLNNNVKAAVQPPQMPLPVAAMPHPNNDSPYQHHPLLGGSIPQGYFPDFSAAFPVPVNMVHVLPPSEQKAFEPPTNPASGRNCSNSGASSEFTTRSRSSSPVASNHENIPEPSQSAPALLQQNGSN